MNPDKILDYQEDDSLYEVFQAFHTIQEAQEFTDLLDDNDVVYQVDKIELLLDSAIVGSKLAPSILVKLLPKDFPKARQLRNEHAEDSFKENYQPETEDYLYTFTDEELVEVVNEPDKWSPEDVVLARKLLARNGIDYSEKELKEIQVKRNQEIRKPKAGNQSWIVSSFGIVFVGSFFFPLAVLFVSLPMGLYFWKDTSVDLNGERYLTYNQDTRRIGFLLLISSIIALAVVSIFRWVIA